jgi:hypothetical protein
MRDVLERPATGLGHATQQHLVEVHADADRRRGDAAPPKLAGMVRELGRVRDTDVGQPIRQQQRALDAGPGTVRRAAGQFLAGGQPAAGEIGRSAGGDVAEHPAQAALALGGGGGEPVEDIHLVVEDHQRRPVVVGQVMRGGVDGLLDELDLGAGHRSGTVEREGDVDRRPVASDGCGRGGRDADDERGFVARRGDGGTLPERDQGQRGRWHRVGHGGSFQVAVRERKRDI